METSSRSPDLLSALSRVPDRRRHNRRIPLPCVLSLSVCAMLCGARSLYAIFQWGRENAPQIAPMLGLANKTPCHASLHYIFSGLDVAAFERELSQWVSQFLPSDPLLAISLDGKALRGIHGEQMPGVHLIATFAHQLGLISDQRAVDTKEGEMIGAQQLLATLDLKGVVITADAQHCQRDTCKQIVQKGGTTS